MLFLLVQLKSKRTEGRVNESQRVVRKWVGSIPLRVMVNGLKIDCVGWKTTRFELYLMLHQTISFAAAAE